MHGMFMIAVTFEFNTLAGDETFTKKPLHLTSYDCF